MNTPNWWRKPGPTPPAPPERPGVVPPRRHVQTIPSAPPIPPKEGLPRRASTMPTVAPIPPAPPFRPEPPTRQPSPRGPVRVPTVPNRGAVPAPSPSGETLRGGPPVPQSTAPGEKLPGLCPVHCTLDLRTMILTIRVDPGVIVARGNSKAYTQHPVTKKTVECHSRDRPQGGFKLVLNVAGCTSVVFGIECKDARAAWVAVIDFNGKGDRWTQNATRF